MRYTTALIYMGEDTLSVLIHKAVNDIDFFVNESKYLAITARYFTIRKPRVIGVFFVIRDLIT